MSLSPEDPVADIMSRTIVTISADSAIEDARRLFGRESIHHLPVVDGDRLVGILSHTDLYRAGIDQTFPEDEPPAAPIIPSVTISHIMRADPVTVSPDDPIALAASILAEGTIHSLPVVREGERLVGLITSSDLIRHFVLMDY